MPYNRPGNIFYTRATKAVLHGRPTIEEGVAGVAVKQKEAAYGAAIADLDRVLVNEDFAIICKGIVQVPEVAGFAVGDMVHITVADNTLTETSAAGTRVFGRVVEIEGERGTPT